MSHREIQDPSEMTGRQIPKGTLVPCRICDLGNGYRRVPCTNCNSTGLVEYQPTDEREFGRRRR